MVFLLFLSCVFCINLMAQTEGAISVVSHNQGLSHLQQEKDVVVYKKQAVTQNQERVGDFHGQKDFFQVEESDILNRHQERSIVTFSNFNPVSSYDFSLLKNDHSFVSKGEWLEQGREEYEKNKEPGEHLYGVVLGSA